LERLHNLLGAVEAFGVCIPDLLDHVLGSTVALGGCGYLLLLSREGFYALQVILERACFEVTTLVLARVTRLLLGSS
jgi:hypothetical protein